MLAAITLTPCHLIESFPLPSTPPPPQRHHLSIKISSLLLRHQEEKFERYNDGCHTTCTRRRAHVDVEGELDTGSPGRLAQNRRKSKLVGAAADALGENWNEKADKMVWVLFVPIYLDGVRGVMRVSCRSCTLDLVRFVVVAVKLDSHGVHSLVFLVWD